MNVIREYTQSVLLPQLRSLGLTKRQREVVVKDVTQRLESVLFHWTDQSFRRTTLVLGTEEASFWEPRTASLEARSLIVVGLRNSALTELNADQAYMNVLRSRNQLLPDERMPWITGAAIDYFQAADLEAAQLPPKRDVFGELASRFPNAWHALSLLGCSSDNEIDYTLPIAEAEPMGFSFSKPMGDCETVVESGFDPRLSDQLSDMLKGIEQREVAVFFSFAFKGVTRNPEKLLSIIDHVLRFGGTFLTPNYLLSPTYLARRKPLLRPAHFTRQIEAQIANSDGLSEQHRQALASLNSSE